MKINITKKLVRNTLAITLAAVCVLAIGILFLSSYLSWKGYYDRMMIEKDKLDYGGGKSVTVLNGVELKLGDGKDFFDNGKARPDKSDFVLTGNFSIDDRDYTEELDDFTIDVPEDFAANGGKITAHYIYVETETVEVEKEIETENGKEIIIEKVEQEKETPFDAELELKLTPVVPASLRLEKAPYLVCFSEKGTFAKDGMELSVIYNDGSVTFVDTGAVSVETAELTADTDSVRVSATVFGHKVYGEVPVTVMTEAEFDNGPLRDIFVEDGIALDVGQKLSEARPKVLARYGNGNRIPLAESEYLVSYNGADENAEVKLGNNFRMTVTLKSNLDVQKTVNVYVTEVRDISAAVTETDGVTFAFEANAEGWADLVVELKNADVRNFGGKWFAEPALVSDVIRILHNGTVKTVERNALTFAGPFDTESEARDSVSKVNLGKFKFVKGDNVVKAEYKTAGVEVCGLSVATYDHKRIIENFGQYLEACVEDGVNISYKTRTMSKTGHIEGISNLPHGACTDGTYVYIGSTQIYKYDARTMKLIGKSAGYEKADNFANCDYMFYKDGNVYMVCEGGKIRYCEAAAITADNTPELSDADIAFEDIPNPVKTVGYSYVQNKYAVSNAQNDMYIVDALTGKTTGGPLRISGAVTGVYCDSEYIYQLFEIGASETTKTVAGMDVYRWDGTLVKKDVRVNGLMDMSSSNNVQSMFVLNGDLYFLVCAWGGNTTAGGTSLPSGGFLSKMIYDDSTLGIEDEQMPFGEYLSLCDEAGVKPKYSTGLVGDTGHIEGVPQYLHGMISDGEYIYISACDYDGFSRIYKVDFETGKTLGNSGGYQKIDAFSNTEFLFYKGGRVYLVKDMGEIVYVEADDITKDKSPELAASGMTFSGITGTIRAVAYDDINDRYAISTTANELYSAGADLVATKIADFSAGKATGVYCDKDYIYTLYEMSANGGSIKSATLGMHIFKWDGTPFKTDFTIPDLLGMDNNNNVQSMFMIGDKTYFGICAWRDGTSPQGVYLPAGAYVSRLTVNPNALKGNVDTFGTWAEQTVIAGKGIDCTASNVAGGNGRLSAYDLAHGLCSDGTYLYVASNNGDNMRIYKVDRTNGAVLGQTADFYKPTWDNLGYLFYRDGYIYVLPTWNPTFYRVRAEDITADNTPAVEECDLRFTGLPDGVYAEEKTDSIISVSYDASRNKYAILTSGNEIYVADGDTFEATRIAEGPGGKLTGIHCDSGHIYAMYEGGVSEACMFIVDWDGCYVAAPFKVPSLNGAGSGNNVQSMTAIDGETYFLIVQWGGSGDYVNGSYLIRVTTA